LYLILTFRSHQEIFIRRSWYSVLQNLDATISCRIKKAVVGVTQLTTQGRHNRMCIKVPCANCDKSYVGETGRKLGVRLHEHKTEVESKTKRAFSRNQRTASLPVWRNSKPLTDHANQANHTIDWKKDYGHRQRTRPSYQVDQGSCTYPQERSSSWIETRAVISWFKPTIAFLVSWCDSWSSHEDSEELSTKFFWWRCRDEIEKSK